MSSRDLTADMLTGIAAGTVRPAIFYEGTFADQLVYPVGVTLDSTRTGTHLSLSADKLTATADGSTGNFGNTQCNTYKSSGLWYYEAHCNAGAQFCVGIATTTVDWNGSNAIATYGGDVAVGYFYDGRVFVNGASVATFAAYAAGDVIGVAFNASGSVTFYKNNASVGTISSGITAGSYAPAVSVVLSLASNNISVNFGGSALTYTPPAGYTAWAGASSLTPEMLRLFTGIGTVDWNGYTWTGGGDLLAFSPVKEAADVQAVGFSVTMSGLPSDKIDLALSRIRQGLPGKLWLGLFDAAGALIADPYMLRRGKFDIAVIDRSGETCTIQAQYEDRLIDLERPRARRYTSADQQRDYPADLGFDFVPSLQDMEIVWR